ncbi:hypothetical protein ACOZ4I_17965 (plasmid) [Haloarcula salina]|uniref:hypothetical protein n=1 Tax=Haloarcula salina TaxID=1429914 RepID=UPI003C6FEEB4
MVPRTRRRFLHVATAAVTALAGCDTLSGGSARSSRSSTESEDAPPASDSETDPPMVRLRGGSDVPPIRLVDPDATETDSPPPSPYRTRDQYEIIDTRDRADQLRVAADEDADRVSSFVAETAFDAETLYLETRRVEECFRLRLCQISWGPTEIETDYVRPLRPYDERCRDGATVFESRLIRLPVALDAESVRSFGTSVSGSSRCGAPGGARAEGGSGGGGGSSMGRRAPDGGAR